MSRENNPWESYQTRSHPSEVLFPHGLIHKAPTNNFANRTHPVTRKTAALMRRDENLEALSPPAKNKKRLYRSVSHWSQPQDGQAFPDDLFTPEKNTRLTRKRGYGEKAFAIYEEDVNSPSPKDPKSLNFSDDEGLTQSISEAPPSSQKRGREETDSVSDGLTDNPHQTKQSKALEKKTAHFVLTKELLQQTTFDIDQWGRKRSQKAKMGKSANDHVEENNAQKPGAKWEWLHMLAFQHLGWAGQKAENLVTGTDAANTQMLEVAEKHLKRLLKNGSLNVSVEADVLAGTDIAQGIRYVISQGKYSLPLSFDATSQEKPTRADGVFAGKVIDRTFNQDQKENDPQEATPAKNSWVEKVTTKRTNLRTPLNERPPAAIWTRE